jgi:hypothetical protein
MVVISKGYDGQGVCHGTATSLHGHVHGHVHVHVHGTVTASALPRPRPRGGYGLDTAAYRPETQNGRRTRRSAPVPELRLSGGAAAAANGNP